MKLQKTFCFIAYALMGVVLVFGQDLPGKDTDVVSLISLSGVDCRRTYDSFGDTGICVAICCGVLREPRSLNSLLASKPQYGLPVNLHAERIPDIELSQAASLFP